MRRFPFFLLLMLCFVPILAQTPSENLRKYGIFRERLKSFVFLAERSDEQGSYLPMESRQLHPDGTVTAYWADGTWWLGHYVAMLATEYARLRMEGDTAAAGATLNELRCALGAYDRLDSVAETCWGGMSELNGFYLRDDVPQSLASRFGAKQVVSDYARHCGDRSSLSNAPSQDQAWASFLGLALVQALTDDTLLHARSASVARRLLKAMQHTDSKGDETWQVTNPVTGAVHQTSGDIQWLKYAHAKACERLTGEKVSFGNATTTSSQKLWQTIQRLFTLDKKGHFNWYGVLALSTVINEGGGIAGSTTYDWLVRKCSELASLRPDLRQPIMFPHFPLISLLLDPKDVRLSVNAAVYESILDAAPSEGAFRRCTDGVWDTTQAPWHTLSLFCPWHAEEGCFNMLDYMLLYNLYRLVYAPEKPQAAVEFTSVRIKVYPNPTSGMLRLDLSCGLAAPECSLFDLQGRLLQKQAVSDGMAELDLKDYAPGYYFLRVTDGNRPASVVKVIKY